MPDPVTHLCIAYMVARHFFKENKLLFLLATLSPDIDCLIGAVYILLTGPLPKTFTELVHRSLIFHPSLTGSFLFLPFFALAVLLFLSFIKRDIVPKSMKKGYVIVLAAILLHLGMDLLQTGNKPLWPLELEAGLDILPYSIEGRIITISCAVGLLFADRLLFKG
jgi:membrane-bound metal-dependent hydrolase YbcI (DUF457 family)